MIGRRDRRSAWMVATAIAAAVALALPSAAAAKSTEEEGAVLEPFSGSPKAALSHWTQARLEEAEPLPVITLPGPPSKGAEEKGSEPVQDDSALAPANGAAVGGEAVTRTAVGGGKEVVAVESTLFPNSANGKVFGVFKIPKGLFTVEKREYQCSGSVVKSVAKDVVLTAGHCVLDPETGTLASEIIFIPGYREGSKPLGRWAAISWATTEAWKKTVGSSYPNEGGDLALLVMSESFDGHNVEEEAGSLNIAFDQACNQTYTQYGYPAEGPYNGEILYSHTTPYAGSDTNPNFSPTPMKIASDFTKGASGGPWSVGPTASPTVLSLTAYGYANQPGYLFGPYFGEAARKAYDLASGNQVPIGIEESCKVPEAPVVAQPTPPPAVITPPAPSISLKVTRVRRRANGSAVLTAKVSAAGQLKLSGTAVRAQSVNTRAAGKYRLIVATKGPTNRKLRQMGKAKVGVEVAFSASGKTKDISKKIQLSRRSADRPAKQRAPHSR